MCRVARVAAIVAVIGGVLALMGCAEHRASSKEFINAGSPTIPSTYQESGDWFGVGSSNDTTVSVSDIPSGAKDGRSGYSFLMRRSASGAPMPSEWAVEVDQELTAGVVTGYSLKYSDRIQLLVTPSDVPFDIEAALARESAPNTRGETRLYRRATIRGVPGVAAQGGLMKWEDGLTYRYPSVVEWQEAGEADIPYVHYVLMGDVPVGQLQRLAAALSK